MTKEPSLIVLEVNVRNATFHPESIGFNLSRKESRLKMGLYFAVGGVSLCMLFCTATEIEL